MHMPFVCIHHKINKQIKNKSIQVESYEQIQMPYDSFLNLCQTVIKKHLMYLPKKYHGFIFNLFIDFMMNE